MNTDDNNGDNLNNTVNTLNSRLNEYVKEHDGFDNLSSNPMINSPYYDINGLINNPKIKQSTDMFQAKVLHLNIQSLSSKFDSLTILLNTLQTNGIYFYYVLLYETCLHNGNKHLFNIPGYNFISKHHTNKTRGRHLCKRINSV